VGAGDWGAQALVASARKLMPQKLAAGRASRRADQR
jgi:hypothetical protein